MIDNDPMPLGARQELFMELLGQLLVWLYANGYKVRGGELLRDPRIAKMNDANGTGISNSLHIDKLAIDLNIFKNGRWLATTEEHAPVGAKWKSLHALAAWGGDFKPPTKPDGNHYSIRYAGRA
jgi:hypothetical protein